MTLRTARLAMAIDVAGDEPPTEFRLFCAGVNPTHKGDLVLDAEDLAAVLAAWKTWGVDLMIDLNHDSLDADDESRADAGDARGWFGLEARGGELWAVNVKWTPDGAQRLRDKRQRYASPVVAHTKDGHIREVINMALVAMPATHGAAPLVAASRDARGTTRLGLGPSLRDREEALRVALRAYASTLGPDKCAFLVDVYDGQVICEIEGMGQPMSLYAVAYALGADGVATLTGEPVRVVRTYVPAQVATLHRAARYVARERAKSRAAAAQ